MASHLHETHLFSRVGILHDLPPLGKVVFSVLFGSIFQKQASRVDETLIVANMKGCTQERRQEQWLAQAQVQGSILKL